MMLYSLSHLMMSMAISLASFFLSFKKYLLVGAMGDTKMTQAQTLPIGAYSLVGEIEHIHGIHEQSCFSKMN